MAPLFLLMSFLSIAGVFGNNPTVRITATDPPSNDIDGIIVQRRGKDAQLTCVVEDKPHIAKVQWEYTNIFGNRSKLLISSATKSEDPFKWSIDRPSATSWRLRVQNAQESDEGQYTCKVEVVSHNNVFDSRLLRVVEFPQIKHLDTSTDMTKSMGKSAKLECYATGIPLPKVKWTRMAGELLPNGGSVLQSNILYIKEVKSSDAGYYICTATNVASSVTRRILLTVKFKPELYTSNPVVKQKVGYVKQLVCNIKGYPPPTANKINWKKEGIPLQFNDRVQLRNIIGAYNRITSIVDIRGVQEKDFGRYECSASNEMGKGLTFVELISNPVPTSDRSYKIVSGMPTVIVNISLTFCMVLFTCLLQHHRALH